MPFIAISIRKGTRYVGIVLRTITRPALIPYYVAFYSDKVKFIPANLYEYQDPIAMAYWIMMDGSRGTSGGLYLCTDSFTLAPLGALFLTL